MGKPPPHVIGPLGEHLTLDRLPVANTRRWTPLRKAEVVAAVRGGLLSFDEACARYSLAIDELITWQRSLNRSGIPEQYRDQWERRDGY